MTAPAAAPASPYKGLAAFEDSELDALFFFGREREAEIIAANLTAYRLTVLYGATGVGKTSVLRAGVAHELRRRALAAREPDYAVVVFDRWSGGVVEGLVDETEAELRRTFGGRVLPPAGDSLADALAAWTDALECEVFLILDQAEEYFLYHGREAALRFGDEFGELVARPGLRVNVLVSLRDDALSKLDRFKSRVPNLFANYLRLDHLDRRAARAAIVRPVEQFNRLSPERAVELQPALVDAVLDQTVAGRVELSDAGRGATEQAAAEGRVEAPYLQLVMQRLWDHESAAGSHALQLETLVRLGGAEEIVRTHLAGALEALSGSERDLAATVFTYLVTPSGTKIAHAVGDLAGYADVNEADLRPVISRLVSERIVRPVSENGAADGRYEIFHDVLAEPIAAWRAAHFASRALERERADARRRHRRLLVLTIASFIALAAMAVVTVFALRQRTEAREQRAAARAQATSARARELVARALGLLSTDPDASLVSSVEAAELDPRAGEDALRESLLASRTRAILGGGGGAVRTALFSPDGRLVATAAAGGQARVFTPNGRLVAILRHRGGVEAVAWSPDGKLLATASADRTAAVWRVPAGKRILVVRHRRRVNDVAFAAGGRLLATASGDRTVRVARLPSGRRVATIRLPRAALKASFSPDGRHVLVVSTDGTARVYSSGTGALEHSLVNGGRVTSAVYSADGLFIATGSADRRVTIWGARRGIRLERPLGGATLGVTAVVFSPRAGAVASASLDGVARLYSVSHGRPIAQLVGHTNFVNDVAFSRDGSWVVTASTDRSARVWSSHTGAQRPYPLLGHRDAVNTARFSRNARLVVTASDDGTARIWDSGAPFELQPLGLRTRACARAAGCRGTVAFSPDGRRFVTAGAANAAQLWLTGASRPRPLRHTRRVGGAVFSPDGRLVATVGDDGIAAVWRASDGRRLRAMRLGGVGRTLAFSPDGSFLLTGSGRGSVAVWSAATGRRLRRLALGAAVTALASAPHGDRALAAGGDGSALLFSLPDGRVVRRLRAQQGTVSAAAFSRDGRTFVTAGGTDRDPTAKLWDARTGAPLRTLRGHAHGLTSAAFSPDGRFVLTASLDTSARLWRVATGRLQAKLAVHLGPVSDAVFSPDGRWIITAGPAAVGLWPAGPSRYLELLRSSGGPLTAASFSPRGHRIVAVAGDGQVRTFRCVICGRTPVLLRLARTRLARLKHRSRR